MSQLRVAIDSIAAGGDGVGRVNGLVVFVPRTAPGDVVTADVTGKQKRFARGVIAAIDTPSRDRVEPPCRHYVVDECGACQLQHLAYPAQLRAKVGIIQDGIGRIAKRAIQPPVVEPSVAEWRYRAKLTLGIRKWPDRTVIGLHRYDRAGDLFQLVDCPITDERVIAVWTSIFGISRLLPADATRGSVRLSESNRATVVIEGDHIWPDAQAFFEALPAIDALWWKPANRARHLVASRGGSASGASFAQVNAQTAARLQAHVLDRVRRHSPATVVDAYAGSGATAIPLAEEGIKVTAIESDKFAAAATASRLPVASRSLTGLVEDLLPSALPADVILLNPPRTGLADAVPGHIEGARSTTRAVIYVSCNPATLGRDLARLPSYRIESVRGFDMFPQTAHVETVCELVPEAA